MFEILSSAVVIHNGNKTEWSLIRIVTRQVTNEMTRSFDLFDPEYDNKYDNRRHENLLQINILGCARDGAYCPITVKPRYNEEPRDLQTLFAITKLCYNLSRFFIYILFHHY